MRKHGLFLFGAKNTSRFMEVRGLTLKGEITMMKAIKNFMNKPITWGDSFMWGLGGLGLYIAILKAIELYGTLAEYKNKAERLDRYNSYRSMDEKI